MPATRKAIESRASNRTLTSPRGRDPTGASTELGPLSRSSPPSVSRKRSASDGKSSSAPTRIATTTATSVSCPAAASRIVSPCRNTGFWASAQPAIVAPSPDERERRYTGDHGGDQRGQPHALGESPEDALCVEVEDDERSDRDGACGEPRAERSGTETVGEGAVAVAVAFGIAAQEDG